MVFGLDAIAGGHVTIDGQAVGRPAPREMLRSGVCYFPADRGRDGLALNRPVRENTSAAALDLRAIGGDGLLRLREEARRVQSVLAAAERATAGAGAAGRPVLRRQSDRKSCSRAGSCATFGCSVRRADRRHRHRRQGRDLRARFAISRKPAPRCYSLLRNSPKLLYLANRIYVMHEGAIVDELAGENKTEAAILPASSAGSSRDSAAGSRTAA